MKCSKCNQEVPEKPKTLVIDGWEYDPQDTQKGVAFKDLVIPKDARLWTAEECIKFHNSHRKELNLEDCWFWIEQPFAFNKEKNLVARFGAGSSEADLCCEGDPSVSIPQLGVRLCRKISKVGGKK